MADSPQRAGGPFSPSESEVGSVASSAARSPTKPSASSSQAYNAARRLGAMQGLAGMSSTNLALGAVGESSTSSNLTGYNAISTLLNNPNKPPRPIDPSSSRYPPISQSHTDIPKVKKAELQGYLTSVKNEWDRYQRNQKLGRRGRAKLESEAAAAAAAAAADGHADAETEVSSNQRGDGEEPGLDDEVRAAFGKRKLPPLSTVPQVFFSEDFDLGNPYTFDLVTERYKAANSAGDGSAVRKGASTLAGYDVALNQMLQEKLSYYSDVVEQHLILEISARSSSFFAELGNLQDLEAEASSCLEKVQSLTRELVDKDENVAKAGLRVIKEQARRREMSERLAVVGLVGMLCERRDLCRLLSQSGDWNEALDVMEDLVAVIEGRIKLDPSATGPDGEAAGSSLPSHVDMDFASVPSVTAMKPQLQEMRDAIAAQLEVEILTVLSADLRERIETRGETVIGPSAQVLESVKSDAVKDGATVAEEPKEDGKPHSTAADDELRLRLATPLRGLVRTAGVEKMCTAYRDVVIRAVRTTMRSCLCNASASVSAFPADQSRGTVEDLATLIDDDEAASGRSDAKLGPGGAEAAAKWRDAGNKVFLEIATHVFNGLTTCIQNIEAQTRVVLQILDEIARGMQTEEATPTNGAPELSMPPGVSPSLPTTFSALVSDVCGLTHTLASRLLSLRSSTHAGLDLTSFLAVFHLTWSFILKTEATCHRMIVGLRGVVLNQAKSWMANFHRQRIEGAAKAVEEEMWGQAEVSAKQQEEIRIIVESATVDPQELLIPIEEIQKLNSPSNGENEQLNEDQQDGLAKTLEIEGKQYFVVGASLQVLKLLSEYLRVVINLPLLTTEVMGRVVEFLKQFNSRTCQVVLGAGAMRSAGLKNITAKHLALASQSLSIMISLIPYVRETVRRHLSPKQAVMLTEFDKLRRDYQEHQYEIHSKLMAIMSDRLTVHCRALSNIDFNTPLPPSSATDDGEPLKPIADLVKETATLHKVLCKYLQSSVVELVIGQVLQSIDQRIASEFEKIEASKEEARQRMKTTRAYFDKKFSPLKFVEWKSQSLEAVIKAKDEAAAAAAAAAATAASKAQSAGQAEGEQQQQQTPTAYKPRIPLFGRKGTSQTLSQQQQQQQQQAEVNGTAARDSNDSARSSSLHLARKEAETPPRPSVEVVAMEPPPAPAKSDAGEEGETESDTPPPVVPEKQKEEEEPKPPPTPSKEENGFSFASTPVDSAAHSGDEPEQRQSNDSAAATPSTPTAKPEANIDGASSPSRGASSPAPMEQPTSPSMTPTKSSGRMSLQQRLAEAARKRAAQQTQGHGSSPARASTPATAAASVDNTEPGSPSGVVNTTAPATVDAPERIEPIKEETAANGLAKEDLAAEGKSNEQSGLTESNAKEIPTNADEENDETAQKTSSDGTETAAAAAPEVPPAPVTSESTETQQGLGAKVKQYDGEEAKETVTDEAKQEAAKKEELNEEEEQQKKEGQKKGVANEEGGGLNESTKNGVASDTDEVTPGEVKADRLAEDAKGAGNEDGAKTEETL
ncbi:hypothetical protein FA10DRAFT_263598 [Acaromyces ingoldii]|uniref:Vacuolar protein sorting-associated protein 54 C-terminal domain-containing protein n=1 Tax=Acaromyces ingoldii TaxID=215250 RepID=A0A316YUX7_9BASI|nr:hypothetical protein FA10DRAFT_263598 [Acaromyces ingoldii]PWN92856.1 hypothetical protein FA10DRAFT_263598 [Acaromyces ingoldii]